MTKFDVASFPVKQTITLVYGMLKSMLEINDTYCGKMSTCFHSEATPLLNVEDYLLRILKYTPFSNECLLSTLIYLDRVVQYSKETDAPIVVNSHNIYRLLVTGIVIASKYCSDVYFTNSRYAQIAGIHPQDLNTLEMELLFLCKFDLMVHPLDLQQFGDHLLLTQLPVNRTDTIPSYAPRHSRMITPPSEFETSLKSGKTSVSLYVEDLAEMMQNTSVNCQKLDNQSIISLQKGLSSQAAKAGQSTLMVPFTLDNSLMKALFNPQSQISLEKRERFLMLLNSCSKRIMNERSRPFVKRLLR